MAQTARCYILIPRLGLLRFVVSDGIIRAIPMQRALI